MEVGLAWVSIGKGEKKQNSFRFYIVDGRDWLGTVAGAWRVTAARLFCRARIMELQASDERQASVHS